MKFITKLLQTWWGRIILTLVLTALILGISYGLIQFCLWIGPVAIILMPYMLVVCWLANSLVYMIKERLGL